MCSLAGNIQKILLTFKVLTTLKRLSKIFKKVTLLILIFHEIIIYNILLKAIAESFLPINTYMYIIYVYILAFLMKYILKRLLKVQEK